MWSRLFHGIIIPGQERCDANSVWWKFQKWRRKGPKIMKAYRAGVSGDARLPVMSTVEETEWHRSWNGFSSSVLVSTLYSKANNSTKGNIITSKSGVLQPKLHLLHCGWHHSQPHKVPCISSDLNYCFTSFPLHPLGKARAGEGRERGRTLVW